MSGEGLAEHFEHDHRDCDERWAAVEAAAEAGDGAVSAAWRSFERALRTHLRMEEEVLFPAFEAAASMRGAGPTHVMRMEHEQMRALLDRMGSAVTRGEVEALLDHGDTLNLLVQQHNMKEEGMLYPMCEQVLGPRWPEIARQLAPYSAERD